MELNIWNGLHMKQMGSSRPTWQQRLEYFASNTVQKSAVMMLSNKQ
jgi:hypothetical protein